MHLKKNFPRIEIARKAVQIICLILLSAGFLGLGPIPILLPILGGLNSQATIGEAFSNLQLMLYESMIPWLALASIFLSAILLGRVFCGWVCPFGFIQDLVGYVKRKRKDVSPGTHRGLVMIKYFILILVLFISGTLAVSLALGIGEGYKQALGIFAPAPFNVLNPADSLFVLLPSIISKLQHGLSEDVVSSLLGAPLVWVRLFIMVLTLLLAVYIPRGWCRYFCPQGAFLALISKFGFLGLRREPLRCIKATCHACVDVCPMRVRILDLPWEKFSDPECIYCLKCVDVCPTKALKLKFS